MLRSDESNTIERALGCPQTKKASYFERISFATKKKDPFEDKAKGDIWIVAGNKLLKKKTYKE